MLTEQRLLDIVRERHLVRRSEIIKSFKDPDAMKVAISLESKGLIQIISPMGETFFIITEKGLGESNLKS